MRRCSPTIVRKKSSSSSLPPEPGQWTARAAGHLPEEAQALLRRVGTIEDRHGRLQREELVRGAEQEQRAPGVLAQRSGPPPLGCAAAPELAVDHSNAHPHRLGPAVGAHRDHGRGVVVVEEAHLLGGQRHGADPDAPLIARRLLPQ